MNRVNWSIPLESDRQASCPRTRKGDLSGPCLVPMTAQKPLEPPAHCSAWNASSPVRNHCNLAPSRNNSVMRPCKNPRPEDPEARVTVPYLPTGLYVEGSP